MSVRFEYLTWFWFGGHDFLRRSDSFATVTTQQAGPRFFFQSITVILRKKIHYTAMNSSSDDISYCLRFIQFVNKKKLPKNFILSRINLVPVYLAYL